MTDAITGQTNLHMLTCDPKVSTMPLLMLCGVSGRRFTRRPLSMADAHTIPTLLLFERAWHPRSSKIAVERPQARLKFPSLGEQRPGCGWGERIMQATPSPRKLSRASSGRTRHNSLVKPTISLLRVSSTIRATKY